MARRGPHHSGPFGLACTSCFESKCKCIARTDGDGCQRCHRLKKQCKRSDSLRRRNLNNKATSKARIAELESKLGGLISQLQARNVIDTDAMQTEQGSPTSAQPLDTQENDAQDSHHTEDDDDDNNNDNNPESVRSTALPMAVTAPEPWAPQHEVSEEEAQTALDTFRSCMLHHFAFVHLPTDLTAHELRCARPFLFRAIVCVMSPSSKEKASRSKELKRAICEAMLGQESQPSVDKMDLLLSLLTYMSWSWDHVLNPSNLSWLMLQAKSLTGENQLDKPDSQDARVMRLFVPGLDSRSENTGDVGMQGFLERHRAVLGCFVLSSIVSTCLGQGDPLPWTPQMQTGLATIGASTACPTDAIFAIQVRLQLLAQKAQQVHQQQQLEQGQVAVTEMTSLPALVDLAALRGQLQHVEVSLSPGISHRGLIMAHIHSTELQIDETTYAVTSTVPIMVSQFSRMAGPESSSSTRDTTNSASSRRERLNCLCRCVHAVQACTSALLALLPSEFRGVSLVQWAQLARNVAALNRLTVLIEDAALGSPTVRSVVDVPALVGRVADKLEVIAQANGEQGQDELFTRLAQTMREFCANGTA